MKLQCDCLKFGKSTAGSNCQTCLLHFIFSESLPDHVDEPNVCQKCSRDKELKLQKNKAAAAEVEQ